MVEVGPGRFEIVSFAKINLMLDVLRKRDDGYHDIVSLMQTISLQDTLLVELKKGRGIELVSNVELPARNTLVRAYEVFSKEIGVDFGLKVKIIKRIPPGAGLGGGSSNAASLLKLLSILRGFDGDLTALASKIGSDVPFFLECGSAAVRGKGEIVERINDLPEYGVVLSVPSVRISTKSAYSWLREGDFGKAPCSPEELHSAYLEWDYKRIRECSYNVFEEVMEGKYWEIDRAKKHLEERYSPIVSMMTGSGSGVFGILPPGKGKFRFVGSSCQAKKSKKLL